MRIYHYDGDNGCFLGTGHADSNPLEQDELLFPAFSTSTPAPKVGAFECARYLRIDGGVPVHHDDGEWFIQPDWRGVALWSTEDGSEVQITEPNIKPESLQATQEQYPGPGYVWRDGHWQEDPVLQRALAEQAAEQELILRLAEANTEIGLIQPAVDGGYAKQEDVESLPQWQRYRYELPDVRYQAGWPESPQWPKKPGTVD